MFCGTKKEQLVQLKHFIEHEGLLQGTVKHPYFNYFFQNLANWLVWRYLKHRPLSEDLNYLIQVFTLRVLINYTSKIKWVTSQFIRRFTAITLHKLGE